MADLAFLTRSRFAHRGLHGAGVVENSRAAFEAAIAAGYGIECDVQASADGVAMVFHDYELNRLTGKRGPMARREAANLGEIVLLGCAETIPTLAETLELIGGRAPLLIEVKVKGARVKKLCRSVSAALAVYEGEAAVMSFNPEVGRWFARNAPGTVRGLVVSEQGEETPVERLKGPMKRAFAMIRATPQYLAYDIRDLPSPFAAALRAKGMPALTWTVRTPEQKSIAAEHADQIIFETI